jgi:alkylhydroperoxidase family enzyme
MARVPFIDYENRPDLAELADRVRQGRRGTVINTYRALFHSPPLAATWFEHLNAVRWRTGLDGRLREIVIVRIAHLNRSAYVLRQHVPRLAEADGLAAAECAALADWRGADFFSAAERAALAFADAMTRDVAVPDPVYADLRRHFDDRSIVELAVLIGSYNMTTRVLVALAIDPEAG